MFNPLIYPSLLPVQITGLLEKAAARNLGNRLEQIHAAKMSGDFRQTTDEARGVQEDIIPHIGKAILELSENHTKMMVFQVSVLVSAHKKKRKMLYFVRTYQ